MLTSTTPSRAKAPPRYQGEALLPPVKPPPWIQTSTGSRAGPRSGVKTLRFSSLSPGMTGSGMMVRPRSGCAEEAPYWPASRIPAQRGCGTGAENRPVSRGGCAKGTPRKRRAGPSRRPRSRPAGGAATTTSGKVRARADDRDLGVAGVAGPGADADGERMLAEAGTVPGHVDVRVDGR